MKHHIFRNLMALVLMLCSMPIMGQDCMEIYFSDGTSRKFFLRDVTEIFTSDYYNGFRCETPDFQYIVTKDNEYVYDIATIDSITFTKFDEGKASGNFASAAKVVHSALNECEDMQEVENYLETIKQAEGVENAWVVDDALKVKIKDWETITFFIDPDESPDNSRASLARQEEIQKLLAKIPVKAGDGPVKAIVANQQTKDESRRYYIYDHYMPLVQDIATCNIHHTYESSPTVDFFSSQMYLYDLVFLVTHGCAYQKNDVYVHELVTADCLGVFDEDEVLEDDDWDQMFEKLDSIRRTHLNASSDHIKYGAVKEERDGVDKIVYYATVTESFLDEKAVGHFNNPNSVFFNTACSSLKGNTNLAYEFLNRGLGVYIGYDGTNCKGKKAGPLFFRSMLGGQSFVKALTSLPYDYLVDDYGGNLYRVTDNRDAEFEKVFIFPVYTTELSDEQATESFNANQYLEFEGITTSSDLDAVTFGIVIDGDEVVTNGQFFESKDKTQLSTAEENGNVQFRVKVKGFKRGQTYYYSAYTYDGEQYNYGNTCSFTIGEEPEEPIVEEDRYLMTIGRDTETSTLYSVTKQMIDRKDYHENADGWKFYRTLLTFDVNRNGSTTTYTLDDNIYMEDGYSSNSAQNAAMLIDLKNNNIYVFCISKDGNGNYTMDGYCYVASLNDFIFRRETVFSGKNWGWYPYFVESADGLPTVAHFSYAGYYAVFSIRYDANNWESVSGNKIKPDEFQNISQQNGLVLIVRDNDSGNEPTGYTSCPDGNHPHPIDLGLPSGTKWACCNVGASEPEDYGGYYAWGETLEKDDYSRYSYTVDADVLDVGGTEMDVAHVQWGGNWQMPTRGQIDELLDNCEMSDMVVKANGVTGVELTSKKGVKIFLPASGYKDGNKLNGKDQHGCYMSANRNPANNSNLFSGMSFGAYSRWRYFRYHGDNVRAVWNK